MNILFIGHNAQPAGAQLLLLQYLDWLSKYRRDVNITILLIKGGPLLKAYQQVGSVYIFPVQKETNNPIFKIYIQYKQKKLIKFLVKKKVDLIYSNTILNSFIFEELGMYDIPIVTHVHEMDYWFSKLNDKEIDLLKYHTYCFFTASRSVSLALENMGIVEAKKTFPVYVFANDPIELENNQGKSLKSYLKLSSNSIIVGACGSENFRKGKDWLLPIAIGVLSKLPHKNVHFVWIGGGSTYHMEYDRIRSNFPDRIHFLDFLPEAHSYFHEFSLFLMISREDPFPIVNIEAGIRGIPVISFMDNGGTHELLDNDLDMLIPYGNLSLMIDKIIFLLNNPIILTQKGMFLRNLVKKKYNKEYVSNIITNKLFDVCASFKNSKK